MAPLEPWEKVNVDFNRFARTTHGAITCIDCHAGQNDADKDRAHEDLLADPSRQPAERCGDCHPDLVEPHLNSLHNTLQGFETSLRSRSIEGDHQAWASLEEMRGNHCASCHASCGNCHVSQPASVGGGLLGGHVFQKTPPMSRSCTACHGSRVGNEYLGRNEGMLGDVHFRIGRMTCADCHDANEMHGVQVNCASCHPDGKEEVAVLPPDAHRYAGMQSPRCETCHSSSATGQDGVEQHLVHEGRLSCQVCHSINYKNCYSCHVQLNEADLPYFKTEPSEMGFLIGRNPLKSYERPYDFVPVRHVPTAVDAYSFYGQDLLGRFLSQPTWRYATPHNVQLNTPQSETCNACHGNPDIFLTIDKIRPEEVAANRSVLITRVPALIPEEVIGP